MKLSESHRDVVNQLALYGIKPEIEHTGTGHLRLRWQAGAQEQSLVIASTPSDYRATMNNVLKVNRLMKAAGITPASPSKRKDSGHKHRSLAELENRIHKLEGDVAMLLDWITSPGVQPQALAKPEPQYPGRKPWMDLDVLWRTLRYDEYTPVKFIPQAIGRTYTATAVLLSKLKKQGLVEHQPRVGWRKHRRLETHTKGD